MNNAREEALNRFPLWLASDDPEDYDEIDASWQNAEAEMQQAAFVAGANWQSRRKPQLTERQMSAWGSAVFEARCITESYITKALFSWVIEWREETRPGRGHDINAHWNDGEHAVQIMMDVYGHYTVSVAETKWLHSGDWEECECNYCEMERGDDE